MAMLFVYGIGWNILFWSIARPSLEHIENDQADGVLDGVLDVAPSAIQELLNKESTTTAYTTSTNLESLEGHSLKTGDGLMEADTGDVVTRSRKNSDTFYGGEGEIALGQRDLAAASSDFSKNSPKHSIQTKIREFLCSPPVIGLMVGVAIGVCAPMRRLLFQNTLSALSPVGDALRTLGEPLICINTMVMAASLAQAKIDVKDTMIYRWYESATNLLRKSQLTDSFTDRDKETDRESDRKRDSGTDHSDNPEKLALVCERKGVSIDPGVELANTSQEEACAHIEGAATNAIEPATLSKKVLSVEKTLKQSVAAKELPSWRYFLHHFMCRLILPPIVVLPILTSFIHLGIIGKSQKLVALVIVIESCVPSAQLILVVCNQYGLPDLAGKISLMYLVHYFVSIFTITFWFSVGMLIIY